MIKSKILRLQAKDLNRKNINIKKITNNFNKSGVVVIENLLNKKKSDFFIDLLEKIHKTGYGLSSSIFSQNQKRVELIIKYCHLPN